jgi:PAS domain S-box-containing protein
MNISSPEKKSKRYIVELEQATENLLVSLQQSTEKYDRILSILENEYLFFRHGADGRFLYMSPSITKLLGYEPEEYIGSNFEIHWTPHPINEKADLHTRLSMQGIRQPPYEMEVYHKNGSYRRFVTIETPIFDSEDQVVAVEGVARDITEKRKIEEKLEKYREHLEELVHQRTSELQASQKKLIDIIDFLPSPTYVIDQQGMVTAWNRAMEEMFGLRKREVIGSYYRDCLQGFHDEKEPLLIDQVWETCRASASAADKGNERIFTERFLPELNDGKGSHVWISAAPILDDENRIVGAIEAYRDVTEIKKAERKIRESEKRLSALMNNLPGMAYRIVKRGHWRVEFVSSGCKSIFGYSSKYFIDKELKFLENIIYPEDAERVAAEIRQAVKMKRPFQNEYRVQNRSGEAKWVYDRGEAIYDDLSGIVSVEGFISDFTFYKRMERKLRNENILLRSSIRDRYKFDNILGNCNAMQKVYELILKAAATEDSVSILGESGTGKELVAMAIHKTSVRAQNRFVAVNCGAIPENLVESEFFGTRKGAFTGATKDKKGYLESAQGGTLFLDEIGEISPAFQVKLLRAIEGGGFSPLGSRDVIKPDVRVIAASNRNLNDLVRTGAMRNDFFFRIHVIPICLPPLRERGDDLLLLIDHFLKAYDSHENSRSLNREDLEILKNHTWPGNVRELQNVLRRFIAFGGPIILDGTEDRSSGERSTGSDEKPANNYTLKVALENYEKQYIQKVLNQNRWHKSRSAEQLGISRKTLFRKMRHHKLL